MLISFLLFAMFVAQKCSYLNALKNSKTVKWCWGRTRCLSPEFISRGSCSSHTFKPLSGQPLLHLTVHLLFTVSVFPMHARFIYTSYSHNINRFKQIRNKDAQTGGYSANFLHPVEMCYASNFSRWPLNPAGLQTDQEYITEHTWWWIWPSFAVPVKGKCLWQPFLKMKKSFISLFLVSVKSLTNRFTEKNDSSNISHLFLYLAACILAFLVTSSSISV